MARGAGVIDDALRVPLKHLGLKFTKGFGPVALAQLRAAMVDELD